MTPVPHSLQSQHANPAAVLQYEEPPKKKLWTSNAVFFVGMHILVLPSLLIYPPWRLPLQTHILSFALWNVAMLGITIGYHRLWSHRSFRTGKIVRSGLAFAGTTAFQGSIKWWCLRHRLHHRFTDDIHHDPYAATRGMLFAHVGWIFWKTEYPRMRLIGREDLDQDPVVRFQHKYYIFLALFSGFILPTLLGAMWGDALGGFLYGGVCIRILIWHCTFLVNSLAHWNGLQKYSDEVTARGNTILALLTNGEGNHNFHAFPHDFRADMNLTAWDPSKWYIWLLARTGLAWGLRRARDEDIAWAVRMQKKRDAAKAAGLDPSELSDKEVDEENHPTLSLGSNSVSSNDDVVWNYDVTLKYACAVPGRCLLIIDGFVIDATKFLGEHPGGAMLIRNYSIRATGSPWVAEQLSPKDSATPMGDWHEAGWAYHGGLNNHTRAAGRRLRQLRIARFDGSTGK
ncbi:hypothetical protein BKA62DRAFT_774349 [Auriculariales sp. MPI-PUGE-AT-0066]|nr:hypothetical protein BKA62DRAFT_774349 [Auriculariales sp. MPI-PUGE-AT-0066]